MNDYTPPRIQTLEAADILEAMGPVSAGSGGGGGNNSNCSFLEWLFGQC